MAPVVTRQIEASDLAWPHQKSAERKEATSPATGVWMDFQRVGRGPAEAGRVASLHRGRWSDFLRIRPGVGFCGDVSVVIAFNSNAR